MVDILFFDRFRIWSPRGRAPAFILTEMVKGIERLINTNIETWNENKEKVEYKIIMVNQFTKPTYTKAKNIRITNL